MSLDVPPESLDELYEDAPCGYCTIAPDGFFLRANRTFLALSGYTSEELVQRRRLQELLTMPGRIYYETHLGPLLRMNGAVRDAALDLVRADERRLPLLVSARAVLDAAGGLRAVRFTCTDASERRRHERELLDSQREAERLAQIVDSAHDAILSFTPDGRIVTWNHGAELLFGYTRAEAVGQRLDALIVPEGHAGEHRQHLTRVELGQVVAGEVVRRHKSGRLLLVSTRATPHIEALGEVGLVSAIVRDVTEQRRLEAQSRHAEQLRTIGTLAAGVAHEVNNQMTVVLGFGDFVRRGLGPLHPLGDDVGAMVTAAERSAAISRQLLAYSRQQFITPVPLDLAVLLDTLAPSLGPRVVAPEAHAPALVKADAAQLATVVRSVVRNAEEADPSDAPVRLTLDVVAIAPDDGELFVSDALVPGRYVVLSVIDTGEGMSAETIARAFEPFYTTRAFGQSRGLGLSMAHGIMRQHDGGIRIESTLGAGTTVSLYLPALA